MSKFIPVVAMIVTIVIAAVNIWMAIKIKFAPDKATLVREMKSVFDKVVRKTLKTVVWLAPWLAGLTLVWLFVSPLPVDRVFISLAIANSLVLFNTYIGYFIGQILKELDHRSSMDDKILGILETLTKTDSTLVDVVKKLKSS